MIPTMLAAHRAPAIHCLDCGYPLAPSSGGVCPECGRAYDAADPTTWSASPPSRAAWLVAAARHAVAIGLVAALGVVGRLMLELELWAGVSRSPWFPIAGVVEGGIARRARAKRRTVALVPRPGRSVRSVPARPRPRRRSRMKPLVRALDAMTPGTTRDQAKAIMDAHFPADGRFPRPVLAADEPDHLLWRVDPTHGAYNAAQAVVRLDPADDTVIATSVSPD